MSSVAIITARGGSKRIPRKNVKSFMGRPMLAYAIGAARESKLFDEVMVSTDDEEIAAIARSEGAAVPFLRSAATASDFATTADVLSEVLSNYGERGQTFDEFCCIYPCVPFLTGEILRTAHEVFAQPETDALMPVVRYSFPIQRAVKLNGVGYLEYREPENASRRSQDLEPTYHDVGMFYFVRTDAFLAKRSVVAGRTRLFEMPEERVQDIDTMDDWRMAEMKFKLLNHA